MIFCLEQKITVGKSEGPEYLIIYPPNGIKLLSNYKNSKDI